MFNELSNCDLVVDRNYGIGKTENAFSFEPIAKLLGVSNQGGIRILGSTKIKKYKLVVLTSNQNDVDWPDYLDNETGELIYFGDNKKPGRVLHHTESFKKGNNVLRDIFESKNLNRVDCPPVFIFFRGAQGVDVEFKGIAIPGTISKNESEELVAVWKTSGTHRFQNYKAYFTILDIQIITRAWIDDIKNGNTLSANCPEVFRNWVETGKIVALKAPKEIKIRNKQEQLPSKKLDSEIISTVYEHFKKTPFKFEKCSIELFKLMAPNVYSLDLTRSWVDGGVDAWGKYRIGTEENGIQVDFALEAKCWKQTSSIGVKEVSRLISRIRYRYFGVFVTTSFFHHQAYKEIKNDQHPIILISAIDIVEILKRGGYNTVESVKTWLKTFD